jgi:hypothetical protein
MTDVRRRGRKNCCQHKIFHQSPSIL